LCADLVPEFVVALQSLDGVLKRALKPVDSIGMVGEISLTRQERRDRNRAIAVGVSVDVGVGTAVREAVYQPRHRQHLAVGSGLDDLRDNLPELEDRVDLALLEQPSEFDLRTGLDRRRRLVRIEAVELSTGRPDKDPVLVEASDDADSVAREIREPVDRRIVGDD